MLTAYTFSDEGPKPAASDPSAAGGGWIDVLNPTPDEDKVAEAFLGVSIPTREEAAEIEFSSRLYAADGAAYLTVSVLSGYEAGDPALTPLTFVLSRDRLATVRYADFVAFRQFLARSGGRETACGDSVDILFHLTEAIIDRLADVVEKTSAAIDDLNRGIFHRGHTRRPAAGGKLRARQLEELLGQVGDQNDVVSKSRESLASLERMLQYAGAVRPGPLAGRKDNDGRMKLMSRDIRSLADQLTFLSNKATFLLEATLGLISVQQNEVIRVLTVAATILLPPTLIGTLYGMNFTFMPELDWPLGYPFAVGLMVLSGLLPYLYFRRRGWF